MIPPAMQPKKLFDVIDRADEYVRLMREGNESEGVSNELKSYIAAYLENVPMDSEKMKTIAGCIADLVYHYANSTTRMDPIIPLYFMDVLGFLFESFRARGVHLFYVLDNDFSTREDRFQLTGYLFDFAGFSVVSPHRLWHGFAKIETQEERFGRMRGSMPQFGTMVADGKAMPFKEIEGIIRHRMAGKGGIVYVEKNADVDHLNKVKKIARKSDYTVLFRNEGSTSKNFRLLQ